MPAIRIDAGSGHGELVLSWIEVVADGPWAAVREIGGIAETTFPELLRKAAALSVVATLQDPDRERRRPLGA
jgi:hypothetical protein